MKINTTLAIRLLGIVLLAGSAISFGLESKAAVTYQDVVSRERQKATHIIPYGTSRDQFAELWLPGGKGPFPVVVLIHGGCWANMKNSIQMTTLLAEDLRVSGIAAWNIEYRRYGTEGAGYPGTFKDIADAIDRLRDVAHDHPLDLSRVVVAGHSAGGHLAMWAAARNRIPVTSKLHRDNPLPVQAAFSLSGVNDLLAFYEKNIPTCGGSKRITEWLVDKNNRQGEDVFSDTSPAAMLPLGVPQFIVAGERDLIVPPYFASDYVAIAKAAGDNVTLLTFSNAAHFDVIAPETDAWQKTKDAMLPYLFKAQ
jgi:acetyl esterase/lipase